MNNRARSGSQGTVSVGTALTTVLSDDNTRVGGTLYNDGPATAFVGYSTAVGTATGYPLLPGSTLNPSFLNNYTGSFYGRSGGTALVRYFVQKH